jgi:hypothetical protein
MKKKLPTGMQPFSRLRSEINTCKNDDKGFSDLIAKK